MSERGEQVVEFVEALGSYSGVCFKHDREGLDSDLPCKRCLELAEALLGEHVPTWRDS